MSDMNSQDVGQKVAGQTGAAGRKLAQNKHMRKLLSKVGKALAKIAKQLIVNIIRTIISFISGLIGPYGLLIMIAIILTLIVTQGIIDKFDWRSEGNERSPAAEIFDVTFADTIKEKHESMTSHLSSKLVYPSNVVSSNDGLEPTDVEVDQSWIHNTLLQLAPSYTLTAAAYANKVIIDGDDWYKDFDDEDLDVSTITVSGEDADIISTPYHTDIEKLNGRLRGVAANKGSVYQKAGEKYGINPAFVAAVSMLESGNGGSSLAVNQNNVGGMSCAKSNPLVKDCYTSPTNNREWSVYESVDKSVEHMAQIFKKNCVDQGKTTVYECWGVYSPPSDGNAHWGPDVVSIMKKMTTSNSLYTMGGQVPVGGSSTVAGGSIVSDMKESILDKLEYYFDDPIWNTNAQYTTESGEKVTSYTVSTCKVYEEVTITDIAVTYQERTEISYEECRYEVVGQGSTWIGGSGYIYWDEYDWVCEPKPNRTQVSTVDVSSPPALPEYPQSNTNTYKNNTDYGYELQTVKKSKITTENTTSHKEMKEVGTKTTTSDETTTSLPERQILSSASTLYSNVTFPYKYITTPARETSVDETEECTIKTYKKYKVKVLDTTSTSASISKDGDKIITFLTETMPEGSKTKLVNEKDLDFFIDMMRGLDQYLPGLRGGDSGPISVGAPSVIVPVQEGSFTSPTVGPITSGYGYRNFNGGSNHAGVDIGERGTNVPIVAAADGVVSRSAFSSSYGNVVYITHTVEGRTWETVYAHMKRRDVSLGQSVVKGQQIGIMGNTGNSFGAHLHFELHLGRWNINKSNSVDPVDYINFITS